MQQQSTAAAASIQPTQWTTPYGREMFSMERFMGAMGQQTKQRQAAAKDTIGRNPETAISIPRPKLAPGEIFSTEQLIATAQQAPQQFKTLMVDDRGNHYLICPVMQDSNALQNLRVIGDIHSSPEVLDEIHEQLRTNATLKYIFLGDYVDRGGEDPLTMQKLAELKAQYPDSVFYICGNHDKYIADPVAVPRRAGARISSSDTLLSGQQNEVLYPIIVLPNSESNSNTQSKNKLKIPLTLPIPHATEFTAATLKKFRTQVTTFINQMPIGIIIPVNIAGTIHTLIFSHGAALLEETQLNWLNTSAVLESYVKKISAATAKNLATSFTQQHIVHFTGHSHLNTFLKYGNGTMPIVNSGSIGADADCAQQATITVEKGRIVVNYLPIAKIAQKNRRIITGIEGSYEEMRSYKTSEFQFYYAHEVLVKDIAELQDISREQFFAALIVQHPIMQAKGSSMDAKIDVCRNILRHYVQDNKPPDILCYFISQVEKQCLGDPEKLQAFRTACNQFPPILQTTQLIHTTTSESLEQLNGLSTLTIAEVCTMRITEEILLATRPEANAATHWQNVQEYLKVLNTKQIELPLLQEQIQATISSIKFAPNCQVPVVIDWLKQYLYANKQCCSALTQMTKLSTEPRHPVYPTQEGLNVEQFTADVAQIATIATAEYVTKQAYTGLSTYALKCLATITNPDKIKIVKTDQAKNTHILVLPQGMSPTNIRIIGDIHSSPEVLTYIEQQLQQNPQLVFICLGDYIDRGGDDLITMQKIARIKAQYPKNAFFIRGNHEQILSDPTLVPEFKSAGGIGDLAALKNGNSMDKTTLKIADANKVPSCFFSTYQERVQIANDQKVLPIALTIATPGTEWLDHDAVKKTITASTELIKSMPIAIVIPLNIGGKQRLFFASHAFPATNMQDTNWTDPLQLLQIYVSEINATAIREINLFLEKENITCICGHIHDNKSFGSMIYTVNSGGYGEPNTKQFGQELRITYGGECKHEEIPDISQELTARYHISRKSRVVESSRAKQNLYLPTTITEIAKIEHVAREQFFAALIIRVASDTKIDENRRIEICYNLLSAYKITEKSPDILCYFLYQLNLHWQHTPEISGIFQKALNFGCRPIDMLKDPTQLLQKCKDKTYVAHYCRQSIATIILHHALTPSSTALKVTLSEALQPYITILKSGNVLLTDLRQYVYAAICAAPLDPTQKWRAKFLADIELDKFGEIFPRPPKESEFFKSQWLSNANLEKELGEFFTFIRQSAINLPPLLGEIAQEYASLQKDNPSIIKFNGLKLFAQARAILRDLPSMLGDFDISKIKWQADTIAQKLPNSDWASEWGTVQSSQQQNATPADTTSFLQSAIYV